MASNPAIALWLQSVCPAGRVAELGSLGRFTMSDAHDSFRRKVDDIFRELVGAERAKWLRADVPSRCMLQIAHAVSSQSEYPEKVGWDIGMHVVDWQGDAAFLVALHLFPERFTEEEIDEGVRSLLIHVPAHVIAAARLAGHSTEEIFPDDTSAS